MGRLSGAEPIYRVAGQFRDRCLTSGTSLLWPDRKVWSIDNVTTFRSAFIDRPDTSDRPFREKLKTQLSDQPEDVHRVAIDLVALYWLVPANVKQQTKLREIRTLLTGRLAETEPDLTILEDAYSTGIANPGTHYFVGSYLQLSFYLEFARRMLTNHADPSDATSCQSIADDIMQDGQYGRAARHMLLHMLFPERYQPIASEGQKRLILEAFRDLSGGTSDLDSGLLNIERVLEARIGAKVDWYHNPAIYQKWSKAITKGRKQEHEEAQTVVGPRYWIEKTLVRGRADREHGELAVGKALWSPQKDKGGKDIYRFMREVQPGDTILHLTDNEGFTAVSVAASPAEPFKAPVGTDRPDGPAYLVRLRDHTKLEPHLSRESFFRQPYGQRLLDLLKSGTKNLFYNDELNLNQGAYLTPALPELLSILNDAYRDVAGRSLIDDFTSVDGASADPVSFPKTSISELAEFTNLAIEDLSELEDLLKKKKQIILEGPPGSGKTYVAESLARYFTGNNLVGSHDERVIIVQFHQSYGYEDFVQGIRPETNVRGQLDYRLQDGIFKRICALAAERPKDPYVIVIDEINRGNISRIFGELLFLLEYRGSSVHLSYSRPDDPPFTVPANVHLVGTMNTTDRSLAQIDYALRRRFYFYRLLPVNSGKAGVLEKWLTKQGLSLESSRRVLTYFVALNERIQQELGEHFQVGHSYFMDSNVGTEQGLTRIWKRAVKPLIEEYFYNRRGRESLIDALAPEHLSIAGD